MRNRIFWAVGLVAAVIGAAAWAATLGIYPSLIPLAGTDMLITYLHGQPVTNTGARFINTFNDVWNFGHTTTAPTLSVCGTTPAISGTDAGGEVTMGTGGPTGCVITFATAYTVTPACTVSWQANLASMAYVVSTAGIALTQTGTSSNLVDYSCHRTP